jgi:hypothetical protein
VHDTTPSQPAGASTVTGAENFMAGQTLADADAVLVPPGPETLSVRRYFCAVAPASAGKVTGTETSFGVEPAAQALVTGSPATAGDPGREPMQTWRRRENAFFTVLDGRAEPDVAA